MMGDTCERCGAFRNPSFAGLHDRGCKPVKVADVIDIEIDSTRLTGSTLVDELRATTAEAEAKTAARARRERIIESARRMFSRWVFDPSTEPEKTRAAARACLVVARAFEDEADAFDFRDDAK